MDRTHPSDRYDTLGSASNRLWMFRIEEQDQTLSKRTYIHNTYSFMDSIIAQSHVRAKPYWWNFVLLPAHSSNSILVQTPLHHYISYAIAPFMTTSWETQTAQLRQGSVEEAFPFLFKNMSTWFVFGTSAIRECEKKKFTNITGNTGGTRTLVYISAITFRRQQRTLAKKKKKIQYRTISFKTSCSDPSPQAKKKRLCALVKFFSSFWIFFSWTKSVSTNIISYTFPQF